VRECAGVCGRTLETGVCECAGPIGPRTTHSSLPRPGSGQIDARTLASVRDGTETTCRVHVVWDEALVRARAYARRVRSGVGGRMCL
jgi:hypothetical protein